MSPRAIRRAAQHKANKLARTTTLHQPYESVPAPVPVELAEISPARLAANRQNALLSTGPTSAAGKAVSSQNRTSHGLARHNGPFMLLPSEDQADFDRLLSALNDEHQPATETESLFVSDMAESRWLRNRAQRLQSTCFDAATGLIADQKSFALYLRYETTHHRAFHQSLRELLKLKAEARKAKLGFEAQRVKNEKHPMKKACSSLQATGAVHTSDGSPLNQEPLQEARELSPERFSIATGPSR